MVRLLVISLFSLLITLSFGLNIQPRIVNGIISSRGIFPSYVLITDRRNVCGGTLLSDRWVLTAAHCIGDSKKTTVYSGITSISEYVSEIVVPRSKQYIYPGYNTTSNANDIALIKLPTPVTFGEFVQPAKLPKHCDTPHMGGQSVIAAGMGLSRFDEKPKLSDLRLRHAHFETMPSEICSVEINDLMEEENPHAIICAYANYRSNQAVIMGDSGGPLLAKGELLGVTSFHKGIVPSLLFEVFARVSYYYKWIERRTGLKMPECNGPQAPSAFKKNIK